MTSHISHGLHITTKIIHNQINILTLTPISLNSPRIKAHLKPLGTPIKDKRGIDRNKPNLPILIPHREEVPWEQNLAASDTKTM